MSSIAPELAVSTWFNTPEPLSLETLRGRVVLLHAFQLLCPGCVAQSIPQVQRIERVFAHTDLQVVGLHTVFEHHEAMSPVTLEAFLHEYRIASPVGVDMADGQVLSFGPRTAEVRDALARAVYAPASA